MNQPDAFNHLLADHQERGAAWAYGLYEEHLALCESEIERLMLPHLMFLAPGWLAPRYGGGLDYGAEIRLEPQKTIGRYRVDFSLEVRPIFQALEPLKIVVECDGHEFHEKTREQAERDKKRDRDLIRAGYFPMRFSGAEIFRNAAACAANVADTIDSFFGDKASLKTKRMAELSAPFRDASESLLRQIRDILDDGEDPS